MSKPLDKSETEALAALFHKVSDLEDTIGEAGDLSAALLHIGRSVESTTEGRAVYCLANKLMDLLADIEDVRGEVFSGLHKYGNPPSPEASVE